jgi:hypothetical protein
MSKTLSPYVLLLSVLLLSGCKAKGQSAFERGQELEKTGDLTGAVAAYKEAGKEDPGGDYGNRGTSRAATLQEKIAIDAVKETERQASIKAAEDAKGKAEQSQARVAELLAKLKTADPAERERLEAELKKMQDELANKKK